MGNVIQFDSEKKKEPKCSFCKKPKSHVKLLIGEEGRPHICNNCVEKCNLLLSDSGNAK